MCMIWNDGGDVAGCLGWSMLGGCAAGEHTPAKPLCISPWKGEGEGVLASPFVTKGDAPPIPSHNPRHCLRTM